MPAPQEKLREIMKRGGLRNYEEGDLATRLPNTASGRGWLSQFDDADVESASRLLAALTLVSHSAFERDLQNLIVDMAKTIDGPIALYATRELEEDIEYFAVMSADRDPFAPLDAVDRGADLGSEARVAALIRNLAKTAPSKLLNHPSLETMRRARVRAIFTIDDIIGSGKRTSDFVSAMWRSPTIKSWFSRKQIGFFALAYTATDFGRIVVASTPPKPAVELVRDCPTFLDIPWRDDIRASIQELCRKYGQRTSKPRMMYGFRDTMAALLFEHGCPNNTPSILWAAKDENENGDEGWKAMFPDRSILPETASAFPPDILARDPVDIFQDLVDLEADVPAAVGGAPALGIATMTVLALVAEGIRNRTALSFATGLRAKECTGLLDRCISKGYLTATLRLTASGRNELKGAGGLPATTKTLPSRGDDEYYPQQLRGSP